MQLTKTEVRPGVFVSKEIHAPQIVSPAPVRVISRLEFAERFTDAELEAVLSSNNGKVRVFLKKLDFVGSVDLDKPSVVAGVNFLEQSGLIGAGRAAEILGNA